MKAALYLCVLATVAFAAGDSAGRGAQIYIYGSWEYPVRSWVPVSCDGEVVAKVRRGRFFAINVSPGKHLLSQDDGIPRPVNAHAGQPSYLRLGQEVSDEPSGKSVIPVLEAVDPDQARKEMVHLVYIDADKLYSSAVPQQDPAPVSRPQLKPRAGRE